MVHADVRLMIYIYLSIINVKNNQAMHTINNSADNRIHRTELVLLKYNRSSSFLNQLI